MTSKITKLTPAQQARFAEWADEWIKIGLSTEPADFDRAIEAALRSYEAANLKRPMIVLRMSSPYGATLGGVLAWAMLREIGAIGATKKIVESQVWSQVRSQVESQVRSQVESQVWSQVGSQVWSQVRSQVGSQVGSQVRSRVGSQVWSQVESQVWSQVGSQVRSQVRSQVGSLPDNGYHGSLYASWGAYVSFFRDVCGWTDPVLKKFEIDEALIRSCGWVSWHENVLAISDRPEVINRDEDGRLHCETGPSMRYRDGWSLWHWHGVAVPKHWIERRDKLDPAEVIKAKSVEQRAAGAAIVGWPKMINKLKRKIIDGNPDSDMGALIELTLPGLPEPGRFLQAQCPRNGVIVEGVPRVSDIDNRPIETVIAAQAWRVGDPQSEYEHPTIRT